MKGRLCPIFVLALIGLFALSSVASAQRAAVKTNVFYDAFSTVNLGAEVGVAPKWTVELAGNYNAWTHSHGRKWKHFLVQPEARYWFCDRFTGHFLAAHALGGKYNVGNLKNSMSFLGTDFSKLSDRRYQGRFGGLGVGYGYAWILGKSWNLEAELGIGWTYTRFDVYPCDECGTKLEENQSHNYFGLTKAAVNLVYCF